MVALNVVTSRSWAAASSLAVWLTSSIAAMEILQEPKPKNALSPADFNAKPATTANASRLREKFGWHQP